MSRPDSHIFFEKRVELMISRQFDRRVYHSEQFPIRLSIYKTDFRSRGSACRR